MVSSRPRVPTRCVQTLTRSSYASAGTAAAPAPPAAGTTHSHSPMKGTLVNRILSSAIKVAGSLAVIGGAVAAAATPAGAAPLPSPGLRGLGHRPHHHRPGRRGHPRLHTRRCPPVSWSPASSPRAGSWTGPACNAAYSDVGSPKVQLYQQVDQLNATDVMSSCRTILGVRFGFTTIQGGLIWTPAQPFLEPIPLPRNPGHQHEDLPPGGGHGHAQQADGSGPVARSR